MHLPYSPSKCPWVLEIHGPKTEVSAYTEKPFVCITHIHANHRIIKNGRWELTRRWVHAYSGEYGTCTCSCSSTFSIQASTFAGSNHTDKHTHKDRKHRNAGMLPCTYRQLSVSTMIDLTRLFIDRDPTTSIEGNRCSGRQV